MNPADTARLVELIRTGRWAALAYADTDGPRISHVAYASDADLSHVWLHLSRLAPHTARLLDEPHCALGISAPDLGEADPQQLPRVSLRGVATAVARDTAAYAAGKTLYLAHLPDAEPLFGFGDFVLFCVRVIEARYVGGFARAYTLTAAQLAGAAKEEKT